MRGGLRRLTLGAYARRRDLCLKFFAAGLRVINVMRLATKTR